MVQALTAKYCKMKSFLLLSDSPDERSYIFCPSPPPPFFFCLLLIPRLEKSYLVFHLANTHSLKFLHIQLIFYIIISLEYTACHFSFTYLFRNAFCQFFIFFFTHFFLPIFFAIMGRNEIF